MAASNQCQKWQWLDAPCRLNSPVPSCVRGRREFRSSVLYPGGWARDPATTHAQARSLLAACLGERNPIQFASSCPGAGTRSDRPRGASAQPTLAEVPGRGDCAEPACRRLRAYHATGLPLHFDHQYTFKEWFHLGGSTSKSGRFAPTPIVPAHCRLSRECPAETIWSGSRIQVSWLWPIHKPCRQRRKIALPANCRARTM